MERLTNRIEVPDNSELIVYTKGKYKDTTTGEMSHDDIRAVLKKLADYEDAEEQGMLLRLPYPLGTEKIENCNSCNATEKIAELPVLTLAKFSEDLVDMAKENWCESHVIMLRRMILATLQGTRYDETLLPEEQELKNMGSEG